MSVDTVHFLNTAGAGVSDLCNFDKVFSDGAKIVLVNGAPPAYVEEVVKEEVKEEVKENMLRCKNYGCQQLFSEEDNVEGSCKSHCAPPIFHDTRKGWSCCKDKMVYDWDEFQAIPPCTSTRHSTIDPKLAFAKSSSSSAPSLQSEGKSEAKVA